MSAKAGSSREAAQYQKSSLVDAAAQLHQLQRALQAALLAEAALDQLQQAGANHLVLGQGERGRGRRLVDMGARDGTGVGRPTWGLMHRWCSVCIRLCPAVCRFAPAFRGSAMQRVASTQ